MNSQVTPCFIPLRELAFTESIDTFISYPTISNVSGEQAVTNATPPRGTDETKPSSADEPQDSITDTSSADDTTKSNIETTDDGLTDTTTTETTAVLRVEPPKESDASTLVESVNKDDETESSRSQTNTTEATTAPLPTYSAEITLCIPYCAALDEHDCCVAIKGCGYPEGGNFGRHGCCPPGYYSELEVLGLVTFASIVIMFVWYLRG